MLIHSNNLNLSPIPQLIRTIQVIHLYDTSGAVLTLFRMSFGAKEYQGGGVGLTFLECNLLA